MRESFTLPLSPAERSYITTAALKGIEVEPGKRLPEKGVTILDLDRNVKKWLGIDSVLVDKYNKEVTMPLRILPDENRDTVRRLTLVKKTLFAGWSNLTNRL